MKYLKRIMIFVVCIGLSLMWSTSLYAYNVNLLKTQTAHILPIKNGKLVYYRFGHGTPIVLICGYATNVSSWNRYFLAKLAQHHEVIVFDNRNVGDSLIRSKQYSAADLANDTDQLIQKLKLNKPTVIGISMGGMIAQQLAVAHPNDVGHLVLINTAIAGHQSVPPSKEVEQVILDTPKGAIRRYMIAIKLLSPPSWWVRMAVDLPKNRFEPKSDPALLGVSAETLKQQQQLILAWAKNDKTALQLKKLNIPTLVLSGGSDDVIPPINSNILAKTIPHAKLLRWPEGGHAMIYQYPDELAGAVNWFVINK